MSTRALDVRFVDEGASFARIDKLTLFILRRPPTVRLINRLRRETVELRAVDPTGWVAFSVVESDAISNIPDDVRDATAALMRDHSATISITVIEGSTFKAIAARAIMNGLQLISRSRNVQKYFGDARSAVDWTLANCAALGAPLVDLTAEVVLRAIEETRRAP